MSTTADGATGTTTLVSGLGQNLCADVWGVSTAPGARLTSYPCHGGSNQTFKFEPTGEIKAYGTMCLDAWTGQGNDGDAVVIWPCHGGPNQQWKLTAAGQIVGINGKCLDVWGASTTPGTGLVIWPCHGGENQKWIASGLTGAPAPAPSPAGGTDGAAELPRTFVDTRMPVVTGRTIAVAAGGDLQGALDAAQPGDEVVLAAGATFVGNYTLRAKGGMTAAQWITVRTAGTLPAEGTRVSPADAAQMPKLLTPNAAEALATAPGAQGWRLVGLEVGATPATTMAYRLVSFGNGDAAAQNTLAAVPSRLVLDRSYVHGHGQLNVRRCLALNSASSAVVDSYFGECHSNEGDSQAVYGWNGPGPFKIVNNHLEGGHEVLGFGGPTPGVPGLIPSDIEVRRNHVTRPLAWRGVWRAKNLFECKSCQRVLIEGNVFENNWADAQVGFALLFQGLSDDNTAPQNRVWDVTIRRNVVRNTAQGLNLLSRVAYGGALPAEPARRITVTNNLFVLDARLNFPGRMAQLLGDLRDVTLAQNTFVDAQGAVLSAAVAFDNTGGTGPAQGLRLSGNVFGATEWSPVLGNSTSTALATFAQFAPDAVCAGNVFVGGNAGGFPAGNYFPGTPAAAGLGGVPGGSYGLAAPLAYLPGGAAVPGADMAALTAATAGVVR